MKNADLTLELAALPQLGVADLRRRYAEVFGEPTRAGNRTWLVKRIAWRLQAFSQGDLSERARQRALPTMPTYALHLPGTLLPRLW
jgi:hypothetical protein